MAETAKKKQNTGKAADAPKPATVEEMAEAKGVAPWAVAGMMRMMRFAPGKVVSKTEFNKAMDKFMKKPMGGNSK